MWEVTCNMSLKTILDVAYKFTDSPIKLFVLFIFCVGLVFLIATIRYFKNEGDHRKAALLTSVICLASAALFGLSALKLIDPNNENYYKIVGSEKSLWSSTFKERYKYDVLNSIDFDNLDVSRMGEPGTIITTKDKSLAYALIDGKGHIVISDGDRWLFSISKNSEQVELNNVYLLLQKEGYKEIRVIAHNAITIYDPVNTGQIINYEDIRI